MVRAKKRQFFFWKKNGASGEAKKRKKRNIDVIFQAGKKIGVSKQKWSVKINKKLVLPKKMERQNIFFLNKKNQSR